MSQKALPIQFLNLGGEMMYIIDQRLRAQEIPKERADQVRNDILSIMLSQRFVEELFHPQSLYSKKALRTVFEKLAHASIMRLNPASMDKLFDLMMMALKQQVLLCPQPKDLIFITLNHLDSMLQFASTLDVQEQVLIVQEYLLKFNQNISMEGWADIRRSLLIFVQDLHIRVSIFLKSGVQDHLGRLVLPTNGPVPVGNNVPGTIRFLDWSGAVSLITLFPSGGNYTNAIEPGSLEIRSDRGTTLGLNVYDESKAVLQESSAIEETLTQLSKLKRAGESNNALKAKEEINLLAEIIGSGEFSKGKEFKLNLCLNEDEESIQINTSESGDEIRIEGAVREDNPELGRIMGELELSQSNEEEDNDLLDLLDSA